MNRVQHLLSQRHYESLFDWHQRLLTCPIIGDLPLLEIAHLSGANASDLQIARTAMRIHRDEARKASEEPKPKEPQRDDSEDEWF